jgi:predicted N-acyltransferase
MSRARILDSIERVPAEHWNALSIGGNPFLRHEFLSALESTGCASPATGWIPQHLIIEEGNAIVGALPLYEKSHSWGEFVFDWSWARAYEQARLPYYPKLVSMVPFSPVPSARLLVHPKADPAAIKAQLIAALRERAEAKRQSSIHVLFTQDADLELLAQSGFLRRYDCQFHWFNRGYRTFDDFIATFRAEKRKKALRERRRIAESGVEFRTLHGADLDAALWRAVFAFSENTFQMRGHEHYLSAEFFERISRMLPDSIMVKLALYREQPIAAAIFLRSDDTLYGRYWGAAAEFHSLHFETCYYQGIEYCIEHGLMRFEPGTQGEHKVPRGFEPTPTSSAHWIADPRFRHAIAKYLEQERAAIDEYMASVREHTPYRRDLNAQETGS